MTIQEIIQSANLYSDNQLYTIVKLPASAITVAAGIIAEIGEPFCGLVVDKDEVTLIIPQEALEDFAPRIPGYQAVESVYRLITFDVILDFSVVGFIAAISSALAQSGISLLPLAAYSRDHILVPASDFDRAVQTIEQLKA